VARFFEAISRLQPQLEIVRWTRLPYVSSGDSKRTHYTLDMAVAVLKLHTENDSSNLHQKSHVKSNITLVDNEI